MDNIILIGMPAVGKSTVGVIVAKRLGYNFVDTDLVIQEKEGKLLREIIAEVGPDGFLEVEDRINAEIEAEKTVIATINKRLRNAKSRGVVLRDGQTLKDLYEERVKLFEKYADVTVCEDGLELEETIEKVLASLN